MERAQKLKVFFGTYITKNKINFIKNIMEVITNAF
jgi:hypothetical protein